MKIIEKIGKMSVLCGYGVLPASNISGGFPGPDAPDDGRPPAIPLSRKEPGPAAGRRLYGDPAGRLTGMESDIPALFRFRGMRNTPQLAPVFFICLPMWKTGLAARSFIFVYTQGAENRQFSRPKLHIPLRPGGFHA
jgi:hypothetical protein